MSPTPGLPPHLRHALDDGDAERAADTAHLEALWARTRDRLEERPARRTRLFVSLATASAIAVVAVLFLRGRGGPLELADGRPLRTVGGEVAQSVGLRDGSRIESEAQARIEAVANGPRETSLLLEKGRARFALAPGRRRFAIDAGLATLEVPADRDAVRTSWSRFAAARDEQGLEVQVFEGQLLVHGERVPGHAVKLGAGGGLRIDHPKHESAQAAPTATPPAAPAPATETRPAATPDQALATPRAAHLPLLHEESPAHPPRPQAAPAPASPSVSVEELLDEADAARRSGRFRDAVAPLERIGREFPADHRAGLAAFTLGRVLVEDLHDPARAAMAFRSAVERGLPASLAESAWLRLVAAQVAAGDRAGARASAAEHHRRYGEGAFGERIDAILILGGR